MILSRTVSPAEIAAEIAANPELSPLQAYWRLRARQQMRRR